MPMPRTFIAAEHRLRSRRGPSIGARARMTRRVRASGTYGAGARMAARGQLCAPDRRLRLGLARQATEELGARRCPALGLGASAIEERRALLFGPAFEWIRHG